MKKAIAMTLLAATISVASIAKPTDPIKTNEKAFDVGLYYDYTSGRIKAFFEKNKEDVLTVRLLDKEGQTISVNTLKNKSSVSKLYYDVNKLADGEYTLKVSDGETESVHKIEIKQPKPWEAVQFD
ncbi:T9SS type A sorting domain-containing protein [Marinilongibacter aquaticus]|uniref:T9SS type A sorting domain-containing protein n=1 Tax=Marinilongibacter aquaticus TaxID=2975157 RepID=UPI0021BDCBCB|nr:T9SS type A sorting domain-containing protein [Marinilongibacter aquaticus]UBM57313.1 T9SS type A sorting domain-containing protein [Marinilongibacter aquaticus]